MNASHDAFLLESLCTFFLFEKFSLIREAFNDQLEVFSCSKNLKCVFLTCNNCNYIIKMGL